MHVQFGFLKNRSTLQQLLIFINEVFTCGTQTDTIYFNICTVFDSVSHSQLPVKLWSAGISGLLGPDLNHTYQQFVVINIQPSSLLPVLSSIPQGNILGPFLFLIYINNIILTFTVFTFSGVVLNMLM